MINNNSENQAERKSYHTPKLLNLAGQTALGKTSTTTTETFNPGNGQWSGIS